MKANLASRCEGREVKEKYANVTNRGPRIVNQRLHRASSALLCYAACKNFFLGSLSEGALETRLNSVAKPTEFVPKLFLACVTFFLSHWRRQGTSACIKHKLKFSKQQRQERFETERLVSKYFSVLQPKFSVLLCNFTTYSKLSK